MKQENYTKGKGFYIEKKESDAGTTYTLVEYNEYGCFDIGVYDSWSESVDALNAIRFPLRW